MKKELKKALRQVTDEFAKIQKIDLGDFSFGLDRPKVENFGDYTTNVAMILAHLAKKDPMEIAEEIKIQISKIKIKGLGKIEVARPGYINFYLTKEYLREKIAEIGKLGKKYGNSRIGKGEKIHLDFVSANPTGPVTLGNARGGTLGDVLANILEKTGHQPWREYYVNDFGNQVKVLGHSVLKDEEAQYKGGYIDDLAKRVKSKEPFLAGEEAAKIILEEIIKPSMEKMNIRFDKYFSEKKLHTRGEIEKVFAELDKKKLTYEKDGALWFRAKKFGDVKDRVIRKSTGEITYFGGDIAYHKNKFERGFSRAIDIWGADHHGDVRRVMGAVEALGYGSKLEIILNQLLRVVKDKKEFRMSKRKGTYISLDDLICEVGCDAVRFFFLMHDRKTHMTFDLDLAKERSEKNPVYYIQYAHARICSILRKKQETKNKKQEVDLSLLVHDKELSLIRELDKFPELIEEIAQNFEVHRLPHYVLQLADKFHSFYNEVKVIDEEKPEITVARLELVKSVRIVIAEALRLLGVNAPDKM